MNRSNIVLNVTLLCTAARRAEVNSVTPLPLSATPGSPPAAATIRHARLLSIWKNRRERRRVAAEVFSRYGLPSRWQNESASRFVLKTTAALGLPRSD
jgi:hypothetical protein